MRLGLVYFEHHSFDRPLGHALGRDQVVDLQAKKAVRVPELAALDVEGEAPKEARVGHDHAVGAVAEREDAPVALDLEIRRGHETTIGFRVPPRCDATCFPHWNGVLPAHAQPAE